MIMDQYVQRTHQFMQALHSVCADRRLPMPDIQQVIITERHQRVFLFVVFPERIGHKQEAYAEPNFLHQLSSMLQGRPVTYSNTTGFRLAALLDSQHEPLPARLDYPEFLPGHVRLGRDAANREVILPWPRLGHGLVVGMTGGGKSSTLRALVAAAVHDQSADHSGGLA